MIPLSKWLSDRSAPLSRPVHAESDGEPQPAPRLERFTAAEVEEAHARGQEQAWAEAAQRIEAVRDSERRNSAQRQEALVSEWSARCAEGLGNALSGAMFQLRTAIESAAIDVLKPFLGEAAAARAAQQLIVLLEEELTRPSEPVLELRAPAALHAPLQAVLEKHHVLAVLTESQRIEAISRAGVTRFENMAQRWIECMNTGET